MPPGIEAGSKKNGVKALRLVDGTIDANAPATARFDRCALDGERPPVIEVPLGKPVGDEQGLARRRQAEMGKTGQEEERHAPDVVSGLKLRRRFRTGHAMHLAGGSRLDQLRQDSDAFDQAWLHRAPNIKDISVDRSCHSKARLPDARKENRLEYCRPGSGLYPAGPVLLRRRYLRPRARGDLLQGMACRRT